MRVELHPEVRVELRAATLWYEEQREGLGSEFVNEMGAALARIGRTPESCPRWPGMARGNRQVIRRLVLRRFPYAMAFEQHEDHLLVLALAHTKRRPVYWLTRVTP